MILRVRSTSRYPLRRATDGASGLDLCANLECERWVNPGERWKIMTGIHVAIPRGYEGQVRGRSGNCINHGIVVPTGTIDSDYRGEIGVILFNLSRDLFQVRPGDRIAQLIVSPIAMPMIDLVDDPDDLGRTERGSGGFGSTGVGGSLASAPCGCPWGPVSYDWRYPPDGDIPIPVEHREGCSVPVEVRNW